ncbi:MAG: tetratricopeptide repeat protein, partial [Candidatus Eisenbacteria bacterium]
RVIWETHAIPTRQIWSWSTYGTPDMNASPLFRAMVWPFWAWGGVSGLFVWRWLTTLLAFAIAWLTARRLGARGLTPLLAITVCVLIYRQRSQVRPETLAAVLTAITLWILETRRAGGPDRSWWLVPVVWIWANAHLSYYLALVILAVFALDEWLPGGARTSGARRDRPLPRLVAVGLAATAAAFVNPFGWHALAQPFQFALLWRHEPIYRTIGELQPVMWSNNTRNGLALVLVAWPLLAVWRGTRVGFDRVELALCLFASVTMLQTQRLTGSYAVIAAPYLARDLDAWVGARSWPAWTRPAWTRALLVTTACVAMCVPEWRRIEMPLGVGLDMTRYPVKACDFVAAHGIEGRMFNDVYLGGYIAWRFWPDRGRLPFATGTPEAMTREDRDLVTYAATTRASWKRLDDKYGFEIALLNRRIETGASFLPDFLDADSTWALVFADDAAALYVRRTRFPALADSFGYRIARGGPEGSAALADRAAADPDFGERYRAELERMTRESPYNARPHTLLARMDFAAGHWDEARAHTLASLAVNPLTPGEHERLGLIALAQDHPTEALLEFQ